MSPATKFVNRIARHTKKDKNAGSFGQRESAIRLGKREIHDDEESTFSVRQQLRKRII